MKRTYFLIFLLFPILLIAQNGAERKESLKKQKALFAVTTLNKKFTAQVVFENPNDMIIVPVTIDGQTYKFLFDTGAITLVSDQLQEKLNLKPLFSNKILDAAGTVQEEEFFTLNGLQIGDVVFNNVTTAAFDLAKFETMFCVKLDGVFGTNVMRKCNWKIDYANKRVIFSDNKIKPQWKAIEMDFAESYSGSPLLIQHLAGKNFYTTMDTGFNGSISISDSVYFKSSKAGKHREYKSYGKSSLTLFDGRTETVEHLVLIDTMYLGNTLLKNKLSDIAPGGMLIGNKFFKEFGEIIIDWNSEKLYLKDAQIREDSEQKTFGFLPVRTDGKVFVGTVWEGSDAEKQGMNPGDIITSINGKDLVNASQEIWCDLVPVFMDSLHNKVSVSIRKEDGSVKQLELKEYNILQQ